MKIDKIKKLFSNFDENIFFEHDLKKKNWFNIGGKSKVFFKADHLNQLIKFLKILNDQERIFILGAGSNILITDDLFDGAVIKLGKNFSQITLHSDDIIIAGSAVLDKNLSNFALENHLSGFEFLSCIPGTIGGGISMNAGCFGKEFKDILVSIQAIDKLGRVISIPAKEIKFEYRKNNIPEDYIFLSASFKGTKSKKNKIEAVINELKSKKEKNQPTRLKTSGSTFKNPISQSSKKVWQLIQESVSLNQSFGDACISKKHCNFFVNKGDAKFQDMKKLIDFVSEKVLKKTGISLEKEIKILE